WGGGGDYDTRLYTAIIAGNGPDTAMVKFQNQPRLMEMEALRPIDDYIKNWSARGDISDSLWKLHAAPDGKRYYVPLQYVVLYLYVRRDWLAQKNLALPTDFPGVLKAAEAMTGGDRWGFGLRGGPGGHDFWCTFVLGGGARLQKGGLVTPAALAANRWFIDLHRAHHVCPPSAPTDGFVQTIANMKAGRTGMTIHHIGSANELSAALGDGLTAIPVPRGPTGDSWATYGDGSSAIFAACKNPEAAWEWISYLSTGASNAELARLSAQLPVTSSSLATWNLQPARFVKASAESLPSARVLPSVSQTADFTRTVWPQTTQKALLGQITPDAMMQVFEKLYYG
ncbi:MAG: extracellular solute-binding protein, partial [Rhodospirillales bacterium]|nr:extracellular solute-binding protein [Rhodospirillales bacterium]